MKYFKVFLTIVLFSFLYSCNNNAEFRDRCEKLSDFEEANALKSEIQAERLTDSLEIINNLIGEWELRGVFSAWTGDEVGPDCILLTITPETIEINDSDSGSITSRQWNLISYNVNGYSGFFISSDEPIFSNRIGIDHFSENFMHGSSRYEVGNTYFYEKVL